MKSLLFLLLLFFIGSFQFFGQSLNSFNQGLFHKEKNKVEPSTKLYLSNGSPSGVTGDWKPLRIDFGYELEDPSFFALREYDGFLIVKEDEYLMDDSEIPRLTRDIQYTNRDFTISDFGPIYYGDPGLQIVNEHHYDSVPFFGGSQYTQKSIFTDTEPPHRVYLMDYEKNVVLHQNGRFDGYEAYRDSVLNTNSSHKVLLSKSNIIKFFYSDLEILGPDTGLYHEFTWSTNAKEYIEEVRPVRLYPDSSLHIIYEKELGTAESYEKMVIQSYHDPLQFQLEEWTTYTTQDSGHTWTPKEHFAVTGELYATHTSQRFLFSDTGWTHDRTDSYLYNQYTRRWDSYFYKTDHYIPYTRGFKLIEQSENKILHEQYFTFNSDTSFKHHFVYSNHEPTQIKQWELPKPLQLFPNPCQKELHISGTQLGTAQLFSYDGKYIRDLDLSLLRHNVADLPAGLYKIVTESGGRAAFVKR